jgi:hypothetical protein
LKASLPAKSTGREMKFPQSSPAYKNMTQNWWNSTSRYHHTKLPKHLLPKQEFVPKRFWNKVAIHTHTHTHTRNQSISVSVCLSVCLCAKQCKKKKYWVEDLVLDPGPVSFHKWPKNTHSCTDSCVGCSLCADRKQEIATSQIQSNLPHPTTS